MKSILCPQCRHTLKYAAVHAGKKVRCQKCNARFLIAPESPPPAPEPFDFSAAIAAPPPPPTPFESREEIIPEALPVTEPPLERYSRELGVGWTTLLAILIGGACLFLLGLTTLFPWVAIQAGNQAVREFLGGPMEVSVIGLESPQGKLTDTATVIGVIALGLGLFVVRRYLPACLLVPGAAGTVSVMLLFSYWHNVKARMAEIADYPLADLAYGQVRGGLQFPVYAAMLLAVGVAAAFIFASVTKPQELPFLRNAGAIPLVQKHGGLIGAQALAVLIGLIVLVVLS